METFWGWQGGQTCQVGAHAWFREPCGDLGAASRAPLDRGIGGWAHPGTSVPGDPPHLQGVWRLETWEGASYAQNGHPFCPVGRRC